MNRMFLKKIIKRFVVLGAVLFPTTLFASESGLQHEIEVLGDLYSTVQAAESMGERADKIKEFARSVKWSGVTDEALFDRLEHDLLNGETPSKKKSRSASREYISWMVQSLAFSGLEKYSDVIASYTDLRSYSQKVTRHAERSLEVIGDFSVWNPNINRGLEEVSYEELPRKRLINLITSDIPELKRVGARLAIDKYKNDLAIMDLVEAELLVLYPKTGGKRMPLDAASWMCRALGESGVKKYIATLEKVLDDSKDRSVRNWAQKSLLKLTEEGTNSSRRTRL